MWAWISLFCALVVTIEGAGVGAARLVCYVDSTREVDNYAECTHLVYAGNARGDKLDAILKDYRKLNSRSKILVRVSADEKELRTLLKSKHIQGLEIQDAHRSLNKTRVQETVEAAKAAIASSGGGPLFLGLPSNPELLAKYYDLRALVKLVDLMMLDTDNLGAESRKTYHPSRLSGMWDMMNTDSVVDLVVGLGVPASKVVISLPATAFRFRLLNETLSTPGSPAVDDQPKEIDQSELCRLLQKGRWTLERDQDLSAPYAFKNTTWISFEDASSVDVKGKYARVRGLAGLALRGADKDLETPCGPSLKAALAKVLNQQSRAPRAAVLRSLEHEILSAPIHARALDALQVSPYRITQVVDSDGVIHSIREDTRTEFSCSRQGYFVHPRTCARFYRCVKFDQLSPEYTVFEFDCPAGLAFDGRYEVCVWPGSLPHSQACPGSSEIAPVPRTRFVCPAQEGYYADPENCRWFFACLDHGTSPLSAYEFRCPFGLGFDAARLTCDWPWLVPACGNIGRYEAHAHGFSAAILTGAAGYNGHTADSVNVAGHQSLISGAALDNHVGIQGGFLSQQDALDGNFIASQELATGQAYQLSNGHDAASLDYQAQGVDLVQPTKYSSGSLLLDDYRLPSAKPSYVQQNGLIGNQYHVANGYSGQKAIRYQAGYAGGDESGAYVHDPTGDHAVPYNHEDAPAVPYIHDASVYKDSNSYKDYNLYKDGSQGQYEGKYDGQYNHDNSGDYHDNGGVYAGSNGGAYRADYSGAYNGVSGSYINGNTGKYVAGVYQSGNNIYGSSIGGNSANIQQYHGSYANGNGAEYLSDSKAYTGSSHTLAAGAVNVGLVGKTTLVDSGYTDQGNFQSIGAGNGYAANVDHHAQNAQLGYVSQPAVAINHLGTDFLNHDGYSYVTTPTASVIPTTATPVAVTTAIPTVTYKTTFVPEPPKTSIKQIFGYSQPALTYVQPTVVPIRQITPKIEVTDYNQAVDYKAYENRDSAVINNYNAVKSESSGYDYPKPSVKFEEGVTYTTAAPAIQVSTFKPQGFSHSQNTQSVSYGYSTPAPALAVEEPFKKVVAYTTGPPTVTYAEPTVATYTPSSFSQQTIHNVQAGQVDNGYQYAKPVVYEQPQTVVEYSTPQPEIVQPVVSYRPQVYTQQTFHKSNANVGYEYKQPVVTYEQPKTVVELSTAQPPVEYQPQVYTQHTYHNTGVNVGYEYNKPAVTYEQPQTVVQVSTPQPPVVSYQPHVYTQQTYQNVDANVGHEYTKPVVTYEQPKTVVQVSTAQPPVVSYQPQVYTQQTYHNVDAKVGYEYTKPLVTYEEPKTVVQVTTAQPEVVSYQPQFNTQQTLHKVDVNKVNTYAQIDSGYDYPKPAVQFVEGQKTVEVSTIQPQTYHQQTIHKIETPVQYVSSTQIPEIQYQQPAVTQYVNPILKYTQKIAPVTYVRPTYQPTVQQHEVKHLISEPVQYETYNQNAQLNQGYQYSQPEIQRETYNYNTGSAYSLASDVSHQVIHQTNVKNQYDTGNKQVTFVSTTPAKLAYEDHYVEYETPKKIVAYKTPEYVAPKETYTVSTVAPAVQQQQYSKVQHDYQYENKQDYEQKVETYKAPDYIPPKTNYQHTFTVSTDAPVVQDYSNSQQDQYNYKQNEYNQYDISQKVIPLPQVTFSTIHEQPKRIESYHSSSYPGSSVIIKPAVYQAPEIQVGYNSEEYLPPITVVSTPKPTVTSTYLPPTYSTTSQKYLPPTTEPTYSTTSREYLPPTPTPEYLPPKVESTYLPPSTTARPIYKSTVPSTTYKFVESTTFKAPEYLPPSDESEQHVISFESFGLRNEDSSAKIRYNPYKGAAVKVEIPTVTSTVIPVTRKQNIVVQTAKANLLGFGTVGPDAGLVSYSSTPAVSSTEGYLPPRRVTSTYAPIQQELVEVTQPPLPVRRTKPKVAVVTKINDFNPFLTRKLGAVCSCQSPIVVLRGRRPDVDYDDDEYSDYGYSGRGDIGSGRVKSSGRANYQTAKTVTVAPVTTTFNPIIVPDDSYYQDIQESVAIIPKNEIHSENYISSTPAVYSTSERGLRIRGRSKAVTAAPTYRTVLLKDATPSPIIVKDEESQAGAIDSQTFNRYGPGGWRGRDETLQGSVDCQRAGLFRHPKQCNKFYACRWDTHKNRFTLHIFNCPVQLSFDPTIGACNWPSQGPACQGDTLLNNNL